MKPHHEFIRLPVKDHFRSLDHTAPANLASRVGRNFEGDSFIFPASQVLRGVYVDSHLRRIAQVPCDLVFSKPVIGATALRGARDEQHPATMRIDVYTLVISP